MTRTRRARALSTLAAVAALPLALAACSDSGSTPAGSSPSASGAAASSGTSTGGAAAAAACDPVAGSQLVVLADDKQLQSSDNIVPVVRTSVAKPPLTDALNAVSKALSQDQLLALNKAVDVDRKKPSDVATQFVSDNKVADGLSGGSGTITVVAANFSENQVLAQVYATALGKAGYKTSVKQSTNREVYEKALEAGEVQVVPEYAATLTQFLDKNAKTSGDITQTVATLKPLAAARGLTVLDPAAANDQNAYAVTTAFASKYGVKTLSDLASKCPGGVKVGGPPELQTRPFGLPGLESTYGLKSAGFTSLDAGGPLTKNGLKNGQVALGLVFSSDSSLTSSAG